MIRVARYASIHDANQDRCTKERKFCTCAKRQWEKQLEWIMAIWILEWIAEFSDSSRTERVVNISIQKSIYIRYGIQKPVNVSFFVECGNGM